MANLKIITSYDSGFSYIGDVCAKSIRAYAKHYGYDYEILPMPESDRPPSWSKINLIGEALRDHDFVMWVDADAFFASTSRNILDEVEPGKDLYMVSHLLPIPHLAPVTHGVCLAVERPNAGIMLVRKSPWLFSLFATLWSMTQYINHPWWETAALSDLLGLRFELTGKLDNNVPSAEWQEKIKWLPLGWNSIANPRTRQALETYAPMIIHCAGMNKAERIQFIKESVFRPLE